MPTNGNHKADTISLYFHIPFCTKKCHYCHFYVIPDKDPFHQLLIEGFKLDLERWKPELAGKKLASIYFGGGTPSLLGAEHLSTILDKVNTLLPFNPNEIEITLEANPESITRQSMQAFLQAGVNRISIGLQSLDDILLQKLGRTHSARQAIHAIENTYLAGIKNISVDLMYDIPFQTLASWHSTLNQIIQQPIAHLSLYNLTIEPHTVFFKYRESLQKELPDAESSTQMYLSAIDIFESAGLHQYEISAFAKNNQYSRHNVGYWTARPFLGFGPSAFSYWNGRRFRAIANLQKYTKMLREGNSPEDFSEQLPPDSHRRELLAIALRLRAGVHLPSFESLHGPLDSLTKKTLEHLLEKGFLSFSKDALSLTEKGILFYDTVAVEIV